MKPLLVVIIGILTLASCCTVNIFKPSYVGIDERVKSYHEEYMDISVRKHITFDKKVTIGFTNIHEGNVVGTCVYGINFREVNLDIDYWNASTKTTRLALVFHELTHCYCKRNHDYGDELSYPEIKCKSNTLSEMELSWPFDGFFDDGCPISLMYPEVISDDCTRSHYQEYIDEMFERCEAW